MAKLVAFVPLLQHDLVVHDLEARLGGVGKGRIFAQIHQQARTGLGDHDLKPAADEVPQLGPGYVGRPQLAGAQLAGDIVGDVGHHFLSGKRDAALEDGKDEKGERQGKHGEFYRRAAALVAKETASGTHAPPGAAIAVFGCRIPAHVPFLPMLDAVSAATLAKTH